MRPPAWPNTVMLQKAGRSYGAGDYLKCESCGGLASLARRSPNANASTLEDQTFSCPGCQAMWTRTVNADGQSVS